MQSLVLPCRRQSQPEEKIPEVQEKRHAVDARILVAQISDFKWGNIRQGQSHWLEGQRRSAKSWQLNRTEKNGKLIKTARLNTRYPLWKKTQKGKRELRIWRRKHDTNVRKKIGRNAIPNRDRQYNGVEKEKGSREEGEKVEASRPNC